MTAGRKCSIGTDSSDRLCRQKERGQPHHRTAQSWADRQIGHPTRYRSMCRHNRPNARLPRHETVGRAPPRHVRRSGAPQPRRRARSIRGYSADPSTYSFPLDPKGFPLGRITQLPAEYAQYSRSTFTRKPEKRYFSSHAPSYAENAPQRIQTRSKIGAAEPRLIHQSGPLDLSHASARSIDEAETGRRRLRLDEFQVELKSGVTVAT